VPKNLQIGVRPTLSNGRFWKFPDTHSHRKPTKNHTTQPCRYQT
jgi:hypothetical protein